MKYEPSHRLAKRDKGVYRENKRLLPSGLYEAIVLDVSKEDWIYLPAQNVQTSGALTIP